MNYDIIENGVNYPGVQDAVYGVMKSRYTRGKDILELGLGVKKLTAHI